MYFSKNPFQQKAGPHLWVIAFFIVMLVEGNGTAQSSNFIFEKLTIEDGLSSNKIEAVLQDREGFYWIATQNGLNRFDGTGFSIFRHDTNDSTSLTNNYCTSLVEGKDGDIWVGTYKGVSRYIRSKGCFQQIYLKHTLRNTEVANRVYNITVDNDGNVWIAGHGLWKYDVSTNQTIFYAHDDANPASLSDNGQINHLVYDQRHNGLWLSTGREVNFLNISDKSFYHQTNNPLHWSIFDQADGLEITLDPQNQVWFRDDATQQLAFFNVEKNRATLTSQKVDYGIKEIKADPDSRIWIFYWLAGSAIYNPETQVTDTTFFTVHHRYSMLTERATSLYVDKQGNYWISTGKGISIYNQANQYYKLHQVIVHNRGKEKDPLSITAMAQQDASYLWVATNLGLFTYSLSDEKYTRVELSIPSTNIRTLLADGEILWLGIDDHLYVLDIRSKRIIHAIKLSRDVYFIKKGNLNDLWVGTWSGGIYHLNISSGAFTPFRHDPDDPGSIRSDFLITASVDSSDVWIGYNAGLGFSKFDPAANRFYHFQPLERDSSSSNAGTITSIMQAGDHGLWLGTHGSGLFRYDASTGLYTHYQQQDGLNSDYINSIIPDEKGNLWISTADGLNYFNVSISSFHHLDIDLVFSDNDVVANGIKGLNNKLFFFCTNEFVEIDPERYQADRNFPKMVISRFRIFDRDVALPEGDEVMHLTYQENFFSFEYSTIKTQPFKAVRYAYMLDGLDKGWNDAGNKQYASYTNVPQGKYTFMVRATNPEGEWSEALISIPLFITPPFWRTWWFISLCIVAIASMAYGLYLYRIRHIKKLYALRAKLSQDLHDDVGASLSSINIYSVVAEKEMESNPKKAKEIVQQINQNSRQVMENMSDIVWAMNTAPHEGATLAGRIKNYGYELLSRKNIECTYKIDNVAERKLQKPEARRQILLIIKEALNNIAKYSDASQADVKVVSEGAYIVVQVADNGNGFNAMDVKEGNGLRNMKQRAISLGGSFELSTSAGEGTHIKCRIPIANISDT